MAAASYQPIVVPEHYDPMFKVDVFLHAPLREHMESSDLSVNILTLCLELDTLCKQELKSHISHGLEHGTIGSTFSDKASVVYKTLQQTLSQVDDTDHVQTFIQESDIEQLFPRVAAYLASPDNLSMKLKRTHVDNYLAQMSHLHHILTLSRQIHHDVTQQTGHKYLAHQLAVLYQAMCCMPSGGKSLSYHKRNIEENFKAFKRSIDSLSSQDEQEKPLSSQVKNWILNVTTSITQVICSMPSDMTEDILALTKLLQQ